MDERHVTVRDTDGTILATVLDMGGGIALSGDLGILTANQAHAVGTELLRMACRKRIEQRRAREEATP